MNKELKKEVITGKLENAEAVAQSCSVRTVFLEIFQICMKTLVSEHLFYS